MLPKQTIELPIINKSSHIEPNQYSHLLKGRLSAEEFNARITTYNTFIQNNNRLNQSRAVNSLSAMIAVGIVLVILIMYKIIPLSYGAAIGIWVNSLVGVIFHFWFALKRSSGKVNGVIKEFNVLDQSKKITWRLMARENGKGTEIAYRSFQLCGKSKYTNILAIDIEPLDAGDIVRDNGGDYVKVDVALEQPANMKDDVKIAVPEPTWSKDNIV